MTGKLSLVVTFRHFTGPLDLAETKTDRIVFKRGYVQQTDSYILTKASVATLSKQLRSSF